MLRFARSLLALLVGLVGIVPLPLEAARAQSASVLLQAPVSDDGLALLVGRGRAEVIGGTGSGRSLRLKRSERLESVAEVHDGLVAGGVRELENGSELVLLQDRAAEPGRLPTPPKTDALQLRPVLLVEDGALVGAAWLEGPDPKRLRVKTADWDGSSWGPAVSVSRISPGSQTGLAGTVMRNGKALLVWSQFDGRDDEIFFSVREDSSWNAPERAFANNHAPDIAPSVTFTRRGAVLAWSRFDGSDYRLWTARFERGGWKNERQIGSPGSLFPDLLRRRDGIYALVRHAAPRGWSVRRMQETGRGSAEAFFPTARRERPLLLRAGTSSAALAWPQTGQVLERRLEHRP